MTAREAAVIPAQAGIHASRIIAVLGAPGTGTRRLAQEVGAFLAAQNIQDILVTEVLAADAVATLVTGLDLFPPDAACITEDARIRAHLHASGVPFQVVYGTGAQRLRGALLALAAAGVLPAGIVPRHEEGGASRAWIGACEKCSDPDCEHRLFTRLRQER